jgi:hypothetical protein
MRPGSLAISPEARRSAYPAKAPAAAARATVDAEPMQYGRAEYQPQTRPETAPLTVKRRPSQVFNVEHAGYSPTRDALSYDSPPPVAHPPPWSVPRLVPPPETRPVVIHSDAVDPVITPRAFALARPEPPSFTAAEEGPRVIDQRQAVGQQIDVGWGRRAGAITAPPPPSPPAIRKVTRPRSPAGRLASGHGPPFRPPSAQGAAPRESTGWTPTPSPPSTGALGRPPARRESPPPLRPAPYFTAGMRDGGVSSSYRRPSSPPLSRPSTTKMLPSRPPSTGSARVATGWTPTPSPERQLALPAPTSTVAVAPRPFSLPVAADSYRPSAMFATAAPAAIPRAATGWTPSPEPMAVQALPIARTVQSPVARAPPPPSRLNMPQPEERLVRIKAVEQREIDKYLGKGGGLRGWDDD